MKDGSRTDMLAALEVGESHLEGRRFSFAEVDRKTIGTDAGQRIYDTIKSAARRATDKTGNQYTIERTTTLIGDDGFLVVVAATRLSGL